MTTFAERLRLARERLGITTVELAERCGITRGAVGHLETGRRENPGKETLERLANALGVSIDWLVTGETTERGAPASLPPTGA